MGQAKLRGTFEQRKAEGIIKAEEKALERDREVAEREAMRTPEERQRSKNAALLLAYLTAMGLGSKI